MSANKYHISASGNYAPCVAVKQACKLGGHVTAEEYNQAVEAGDPRFTTNSKNSYAFTKAAEQQFAQAQKEYDASLKRDAEYKKELKEWEEQNPRPYGRPILYPTVDRVGKNALDQVKILLQKHGVNPAKAKFIVQDTPVSGPDAYLPPVKKKDEFDADIEAKTTAARAEAETHPRVTIARETLTAYQDQQAWERKRVEQFLSLKQKHNVDLGPVYHRLELTHEYLAVRRAWGKNGVPSDAQEVSNLTEIKPFQVAVDDKGEISNVWYALPDGAVEKVVAYTPPAGQQYGSEGGYFVTKTGKKIQKKVHHHSYRKQVTDPANDASRILITPIPEGAKTYPADNFSVYTEIDSGG